MNQFLASVSTQRRRSSATKLPVAATTTTCDDDVGMKDHEPHNNNSIFRSNAAMPPKSAADVEEGSHHNDGKYNSNGNGNGSQTERFLVTKTSDDDNDGSVSKQAHNHKFSFLNGTGGVKAITACLLYSFCSVSMILVNKSLASSYNHLIVTPDGQKADLNILLVVFQAAAAVVFLWGCKLANVLDYPDLSWPVARSWAPVNICFCLMLFTSMAALETNSVPMVTVFKNVANITTATADYFFFGNVLEPLSIAAFGVMLIGAVAASRNDMETSFVGLFWMLFNCFSTTGYVCYMRYATQTIKLSKFGMVYINNVLCVLFLVPVAFFKGEIKLFAISTALHTWDYGFKNFFAGFVGFFLNTASLHCVSVTGPTTYAIVGSLNKVPVTFLGWFLFKEQLSPKTWFFVSISLVGGFLYTFAKIRSKKKSDHDNKQLARGTSTLSVEPLNSNNHDNGKK